jgi:Flp pilus assembly protein TadD
VTSRALGAGLAIAFVLTASSAIAQDKPFDPAKELLRIAKMRQDDRLLASFAEARGRSAPNLTEKELFVIVDTVEKVGTPEHAIKMLQDRVKKFPKELDAHVSLAKMYVRASQTPSAIPVWKNIALKLGLTPPLAIEYAHVLSATGDHAGSLSVLASIRDKAPDDAFDYWTQLAQVAWDQDQTATALLAYKKVWKADPPVPAVSSRLMQLLAEAGELDEAIVVAKQALVREKNPAHLLFVARLQIARGDFSSAKRTLDLAEDQRALVASTLEYWMLRAEVLSKLGDRDGTRAAHRIALHLDPSAPGVRAALLWDSIDRADLRTLAVDLKEWAPDALRDKEMWAPTAVGLDRIGRTRDAIRFFALQAKETPLDHLWSLEFSEALGRVGEEAMSSRLRRRAFAGIRTLAQAALTRPPAAPSKPPAAVLAAAAVVARSAAVPAPVPAAAAAPAAKPAAALAPVLDAEATEKLLETHAFLTQQLRGEPEAERLVRRMLAAKKPSLALEEFAVGWYLQEGDVDTARRHLARARLHRLERSSARRYSLLVAMAEDDRVEIERLLDTSHDLSDGERAAAYLRIERDDLAAQPIIAMLEQADASTGVQGPASVLPADSDAPTLRRELQAIDERTSPSVRGGGTFTYINDLAVGGPATGGSYPLGQTRLVFGAGARQFEDFGASSVDVGGRREADADVLARRIGPRHVTELRLGIDYQTDTPNGIPIPRGGYTGVFQLAKKLAVGVDVTLDGRIEDTSFLRIAGLRNAVTTDIAYEPARKVFLIGTLVAHEDHTRTFKYLGVEAGGGIEAGYKILEKVPEWSVGGRIGAYGRDNRSDVPVEYRSIVKANESRASLYPPSYQQAMVVMRIARGDFFERARQELVAFPRYDCEVNGGLLFGFGVRGAKPAAAAAVRCALSVRVPSNGYVSMSGEYIKGVTGLAEADNALVGLTFTQLLR